MQAEALTPLERGLAYRRIAILAAYALPSYVTLMVGLLIWVHTPMFTMFYILGFAGIARWQRRQLRAIGIPDGAVPTAVRDFTPNQMRWLYVLLAALVLVLCGLITYAILR